jgi:hypothetical protein
MLEVWRQTDADVGSAAWFRIIEQAGPELTWEWLMVDSTKSYAELFSDELRRRVHAALKKDAGHEAWMTRKDGMNRGPLRSARETRGWLGAGA